MIKRKGKQQHGEVIFGWSISSNKISSNLAISSTGDGNKIEMHFENNLNNTG